MEQTENFGKSAKVRTDVSPEDRIFEFSILNAEDILLKDYENKEVPSSDWVYVLLNSDYEEYGMSEFKNFIEDTSDTEKYSFLYKYTNTWKAEVRNLFKDEIIEGKEHFEINKFLFILSLCELDNACTFCSEIDSPFG